MFSKQDTINYIENFDLSNKYVNSIYLFGSVARDEHTEDSDLDICIVIDGISRNKFWSLSWFKSFEEFLFSLGFKDYDVIVMSMYEFSSSSLFVSEIKKGVCLYNARFGAKEV